MSEHQCCARTWPQGAYKSHGCASKGKVERDGNWYCGRHDPVAVAEKNKKRKAHEAVLQKANDERWERLKEKDRRSACYPELLEALVAAEAALTRHVATSNWDELKQVRAAIAKATGGAA